VTCVEARIHSGQRYPRRRHDFVNEAQVGMMTRAKFRAWVKTLSPEEATRWRKVRRRQSQRRYELLHPSSTLTPEQREAKEVAWRRWRERNPEKVRAKARAAYQRMKADPAKYAAYLQRKREQMRERRAREAS